MIDRFIANYLLEYQIIILNIVLYLNLGKLGVLVLLVNLDIS